MGTNPAYINGKIVAFLREYRKADFLAGHASATESVAAKLGEVKAKLERISRGHTITRYLGGGLHENPDGAVKTQVEILITPETELARECLEILQGVVEGNDG